MWIAKLPEISHFFNLHDSSLGRHVTAASRKSLIISSSVIYHKTKNLLLKRNLYENYFPAALIHRESKISVGSLSLIHI